MLSRIWIAGAMLVCSSCSQLLPQSSNAMPDQAPDNLQYISPVSATELAVATDGQQLLLADSPWGTDVRLLVRKRYFAATGRICLDALANEEPVLICDFNEAGWAAQRVLSEQE